MDTSGGVAAGLRGVPWRLSYRTSALKPDGHPVNILHDFYIPVLQHATRYDRVAGYFRSSSLAAASQGFSAFVGRQGTMRLIVGADLEPQDVPEVPVKVVGYAVAHRDEDGGTACRLVTAIHDLAMVQIHEDIQLIDTDIEPLRHTLVATVREEYQTTLAVPRIEALNEAAGRSQTMLDYLVIRGIILWRQRTRGAEPLFWREITALEDIFQEPDRMVRVRRIPSVQAQHLSHLLFDITVPTTGDESYLDAPRPLLIASLEAAHRLANGMKVRRSELSTDELLARLNWAIERGDS